MSAIRELLNDLRTFESSPESVGYDLRLDLADILLRHLSVRGLTQDKLATLSAMKPAQITRIVHAASNCTFETAGRVLSALGVKAKLVENVDGGIVQELCTHRTILSTRQKTPDKLEKGHGEKETQNEAGSLEPRNSLGSRYVQKQCG